jgi:hypothetical protein
MAPFHTRNSVHTDPNGMLITASFFMVNQIPGKLLEFPIWLPAILKIQSRVASCRPRPVSSRSIVAPHDRLVRRAAQNRARRANAKSVARQGFCRETVARPGWPHPRCPSPRRPSTMAPDWTPPGTTRTRT